MKKLIFILLLIVPLTVLGQSHTGESFRVYPDYSRKIQIGDFNQAFFNVTRTLTQWIFGVGLTTTKGRIKNTTHITDSDSPYTVLSTDHEIYCNTDSGAITVNLPVGVDGTEYSFFNTGDTGNLVTTTPNGSQEIDGVNASKAFGEGVVKLTFETTEHWR